jgi:hypothetical protein
MGCRRRYIVLTEGTSRRQRQLAGIRFTSTRSTPS